MKEPRIVKLTTELKETVDRLNRITTILDKAGVAYKLPRNNDGTHEVTYVIQRVEY